MLLEGQQLDRYRLIRRLGSGGMGDVYLAEDVQLLRRVAIKVIWTDNALHSDDDSTKEAARLFLREAQVIARLDHIHILPLYGSGEATVDGTTIRYMVMPYRREGSLADWLRNREGLKQLSPQDVAHIVRQASAALQYAHKHGIVHLDVKPSNFLLRNWNENSNRPDLLLADFGIAKLNTTNSSSISGAIRGTPAYMAPEQWEGQPGPATDQYALAIMAYELLTGRPPFVGSNHQQLWYQHRHVDPQPPSTLNPIIPRSIDHVLLRALAKNPTDRFASISAFGTALEQASKKISFPLIPLEESSVKQENTVQGFNRITTAPPRTALVPSIPSYQRSSRLRTFRPIFLIFWAVIVWYVGNATWNVYQLLHEQTKPPTLKGVVGALVLPHPLDNLNTPLWVFIAFTIPLVLILLRIVLALIRYIRTKRDMQHEHKVLQARKIHEELDEDLQSKEVSSQLPRSQEAPLDTGQVLLGTMLSDQPSLKNDAPPEIPQAEPSFLLSLLPTLRAPVPKGISAPQGITTAICRGHSGEVYGVAWSPDGKRIVSASADRTVQVWDAATGDRICTCYGHADWVRAVAWSPDSKRIASASNDKTVQVWDAATGNKTLSYAGHTDSWLGGVLAIAWAYDGSHIASAGEDQTVQVWDAITGRDAFIYQGHSAPVDAIAWFPGGQSVASGSYDTTVQVWQALESYSDTMMTR